eukprot:CAMPEP_0206015060 /NCGR_PEP_ID=MMETSP1464-20131121/19353_1 /ASSEMBLY_ACC=CAM_ASM_001124 /TAXON_ID=119497 /ORGANISM="Exanthemachrysis gayraliae, Strain RCC1523" /LENGTH=76 /DNA_ID=CAMNT_0053388837 /DNA_START=15 /DNA_END=243 /DNA_ORIENTATION=+
MAARTRDSITRKPGRARNHTRPIRVSQPSSRSVIVAGARPAQAPAPGSATTRGPVAPAKQRAPPAHARGAARSAAH